MRTHISSIVVPLAIALNAAAQGQNEAPPALPIGQPMADVDLMTSGGSAVFAAQWRYSDAKIVETQFNAPGVDRNTPGPVNTTYDIAPRAGEANFDDSSWPIIDPTTLDQRRAGGKVCFNWYRVNFTMPSELGGGSVGGTTAVLSITVDDYAEVWVNGQLPRALDQDNANLVTGWNKPNRVVLSSDVKPGERVQVAIFGINGPISAAPTNYIWLREARIEFYPKAHAIVPRKVKPEIVRNDPALNEIIPKDAAIEQIVEGLQFGEGPVWVNASDKEASHLLFSDPNANIIYRWSPTAGLSIFQTNSGYSGDDISRYRQPGSNGLAIDAHGRLTINQHGNRQVLRVESNGSRTVLADRFEGKRLNSPNDLVYRADGALFFTDPPFGLPMVYDDRAKELPYCGVFCLINGQLKLVATDLTGPNGIALSPDERFLYVSNWDESKKIIMRYDAARDGTLSNGHVFFDMTAAPGEEALDGLKVDQRGNVYSSGPGGVWIISPNGQHLGTIRTPQLPANMAWGDEDGRTLYMTARSAMYRMRINIAGMTRPAQSLIEQRAHVVGAGAIR
jgi:gluconolactonase